MEYKLTIFPIMEAGNAYTTFFFETKKEMDAAHNTAASLLLFLQDDLKVMEDYSNVFIRERKVDNEWEEIEEEVECE